MGDCERCGEKNSLQNSWVCDYCETASEHIRRVRTQKLNDVEAGLQHMYVTPTIIRANKHQVVVNVRFIAFLFFALAILSLFVCIMQLAYFNMRGVCYSVKRAPFFLSGGVD